MKTCWRCKECKEDSEFHKRSREKDGLARECKACKSKSGKEYNERNKETIKAKKKAYRQKNKEKVREGQKKAIDKNKEHYESYSRKYSEKRREYNKRRCKERYLANKEEIAEKLKAKRRAMPQKYMFNAAKYRAKKVGIDFSLVPDDIIVPQICPILGIQISITDLKREKQSPSLDRLDNSKGYTKDNSWVISSLANSMKNDATFEELVLFAKWIVGESNFSTEDQEIEHKVLRRWHSGIKARCKRDGIIFEILPDDLYLPKVCPVFGEVLSKNLPACSKMLPTVDKIVPELGYTKENIQVISMQANTMKSKATKLELFSFAGWVFKNFAPEYLTQGATNAILIHTLMQNQLQEEAQKLL